MTIKDIKDFVQPASGPYNQTVEMKAAQGYRVMPGAPAIADGYTRISMVPADLDGINGQWEVVDRLTSDIEAEQLAAKIATFPAPQAYKFRELMRKHFGPDAETNREITADAVEYHFATATGLSGDDVRDGIFLKELFVKLANWNGTGETWTLPWGVLP
jgi:hypothetical protein